MLREMKIRRPVLTEEEQQEIRKKWLEELNESRIGTSPVRDLDHLIYLIEENAGAIHDVMQDKDVNGHYSPSLQASFDDTMDILDYLRKLRNPVDTQ
jgi:hypothetical protein